MRRQCPSRSAAEAITAELGGHKVTLVPASVTGRVPVLEIAVPDAHGAPAPSAARQSAGAPVGVAIRRGAC